MWQRPQPDTPNPIPGKTLLIGHTPVVCLSRSDAEADVLCGYAEYPARALACLRLDDLAEFYC